MIARNMKALVIAAVALATFRTASAEPEIGDVALYQALLDMGTDLRLMCVAAHPDDEDGATLAMYRKKWGYKTFALIATRGEGGQNETGPELYNELGVIRTHEMKRASEITGAELHFLDLPEFGYSKSSEETYAIWGPKEALRRMVRKIRELKPDVIISHHNTETGHGHHQVVGITLLEAFDAAADPAQFPEQIAEGLEPWQVARFYIRPFGGGAKGIGEPIVNNIAEMDQARGFTYAEMAGQALFEHKSQGMGFFVERFLSTRSSTTYYLQKEAPGGTQGGGALVHPGGDLFAGLKDRVSPEARAIAEANPNRVDAKAAALLQLASAMDENSKARANRLAAIAMQLKLRAKISDLEVVTGQKIDISAELFDYGESDGKKVGFALEPAPWLGSDPIEPKSVDVSDIQNAAHSFSVTIPSGVKPTIPHPEKLFTEHFLIPQYTLIATVETDGPPVSVRAPILVDVAPAVSMEFVDAPYLVRRGVDSKARFDLKLTNRSPGPIDANVALSSSPAIQFQESNLKVSFGGTGDQKVIPINASIAPGAEAGAHLVGAQIEGQETNASTTARLVDIVVPENIRVGVIQSYDDTFVKTLARLHVPHEALTVEDFVPETLDTFTTIIVDIRAYLVRPDLVANNQALLDYVKRGGTVIVNYHKTFEWKPEFAPYVLKIGGSRVTVEGAPIVLLQPEHPMFNTPNKIVDADWSDWIQERGLYFASSWDAAFTPLIETKDPGENPAPGSCLVAKYGEGTYMYTALGWYRQLRDLHVGTLRVFANMLAL